MATNYVLFIHGVDTKSATYAQPLIDAIARKTTVPLKPVPIFWDSIDGKQQRAQRLHDAYTQARTWNQLWFKDLRLGDILNFTSDVAFYVSRYNGGAIADLIWRTWQQQIPLSPSPDDCLHLVTHSLGTVILFDLLFSARWDNAPPTLPGAKSVWPLREAIYGIAPHPNKGIRLRSITTMGSPIGMFSLIDVDQSPNDARDPKTGAPLATHDITPRLQTMLNYLHTRLGDQQLPWRNYLHPGDPIGSPLEVLLKQLVDGEGKYLDVTDIITPANPLEIVKEHLPGALYDMLASAVGWNILSVLDGANAHSSYWTNDTVAQGIAELMK